ncbi:NAD(P)/FAD-dependent oxidoreductase [Leptothrix sp. BB-4]
MACIAIVGAGPSGAAAGRHLALRGHAVTLIDRARFPRDKTCGDWLTPIALRELAALGLDADALEARVPGHAQVLRSTLVSPDGHRSEQPASQPGRCIRREHLDALLVTQALQAGCRLEQRTVRRIDRRDPEWAGYDHVIDARGAGSARANAVGLRTYWTVRRHPETLALADEVGLHTDARHRRGYGWIFPVEVDAQMLTFNIGVGLWQRDSRPGATVHDYLARFLEHNPVTRRLAPHRLGETRRHGYPVALGGWWQDVVDDGVLRIGDAAGLADPLTGDGIGNALTSGRLVAEAIDAARAGASGNGPDAAALWRRRHAEHLAPELRRALLLRHLLVSTTAKNLATAVLDRGPASWRERLHGAVFGSSSYRALMSTGAARAARGVVA